MADLLIAGDSEFDRSVVKEALHGLGHWNAEFVANGAEALQRLAEREYDLLLTDLQMPSMTGRQLLDDLRRRHSSIPVVIMTPRGSEKMAVDALRAGASNYVTRSELRRDLPEVIENVMRAKVAAQTSRVLLDAFELVDYRFSISNDPELRSAAVAFIQNAARQFGRLNEADLTRLGIALDEALANAVIHGNLEVSSDLREDGCDIFEQMIAHRRLMAPWRDRRVTIAVRVSPEVLTCTMTDEGRGFDVRSVPDPTDPARLYRASGRGLLLIRSFMDTVHHNAAGNEITMIKRLIADDQLSPSAGGAALCPC